MHPSSGLRFIKISLKCIIAKIVSTHSSVVHTQFSENHEIREHTQAQTLAIGSCMARPSYLPGENMGDTSVSLVAAFLYRVFSIHFA